MLFDLRPLHRSRSAQLSHRLPTSRHSLCSLRTCLILATFLVFGLSPAFAQAPTLEQCDLEVQNAPENPASYYCFVQAATASGRFEDAAARLTEIRRLHPERQRAVLCLASIRHAQGHAAAEQLYREAVVENKAAGDSWGEVYARSGLGRLLVDYGRLDQAADALQLARVVAETLNDVAMLADVLTRQAGVAFARSDYGKALAVYREAESMVFPDGPEYLQSWVLSGLGSVYWSFGDYRKAMTFYEQEAELARRRGDLFSAASVRWNIALMAAGLFTTHEMRKDEVRELLDLALEAAVEGNNKGVEASCRVGLGQLLQGRDAVEELEKALALSETAEGRLLARRHLARATFDLGPQHQEDGLRQLEAVNQDARDLGSAFQVARGEVMRATMVREFRTEEEAIEAGLHALVEVETVRARQQEGRTRALVFSRWGSAYDSLVDWLLDSLDRSVDPERLQELALLVMEKRRTRELLQHLEAVGASLPSVEDLQLTKVRERLAPDQMLLSYQLWERGRDSETGQDSEGGSWLMAITRNDVQVIELPGAHKLAQQVAIFAGLLESRDGADRKVAGRLYEALLGKALRGADRSILRLIIIPDGPLHELPFAALRPATDKPALAETHILSIVPSASIWMRWEGMSEPLSIGSGVLSLADPDLPELTPAPVRGGNSWAAEPWYGALPHARREAAAVVRYLGAGQVRAGAQANEAWLKSTDLTSFPVLHFAAHAIVHTDRPERGAVLLSAGGDEEDGLLKMNEIVNLDLVGRLVILSSCRSATGSFVQGEGVMGLAHAFFQAGARTIVGSLWPLRDDEAADIVEEISKGIADGASIDEALAGAQKIMISRGAPADAWAGFIVLGDGSMRLAVPRRVDPLLYWLSGLLAAAALFFLVASLLLRRNRPDRV